MRVAVLYNHDFEAATRAGGALDVPPSREADAEVEETARVIQATLEELGVEASVFAVEETTDGLVDHLRAEEIGLVFNLVESLAGDPSREAEVPRLLDGAGIPYTGNGVSTLGLALEKDKAKAILEAHGIAVPRGFSVDDVGASTLRDSMRTNGLEFPVFVKPARTDASIGIDQRSLAASFDALVDRVRWLKQHIRGPCLVEEYLPGREINVAIFPNPSTGRLVLTEVDFSAYPAGHAPIVTYACKWLPEDPEFRARSIPCGGRISKNLELDVKQVARTAFMALGGTSYGRVDLRLDSMGCPRVIDVNPNPDLDPGAGLAIAARSDGVAYTDLIASITEDVWQRGEA